jgi:hypothetical protein
MKYLKLFVCLNLTLSFAVTASAQSLSPQAAELERLPPALKESLTMYLLEGTNTAVINLKNYWLPTRDKDEFSRNIRERIRDLDRYMGDPRKVELIFERILTDSLRSYYLLIGYEEGVIFARFDIYSVDEKAWLISYAMDSDIEAVVPDLIETTE